MESARNIIANSWARTDVSEGAKTESPSVKFLSREVKVLNAGEGSDTTTKSSEEAKKTFEALGQAVEKYFSKSSSDISDITGKEALNYTKDKYNPTINLTNNPNKIRDAGDRIGKYLDSLSQPSTSVPEELKKTASENSKTSLPNETRRLTKIGSDTKSSLNKQAKKLGAHITLLFTRLYQTSTTNIKSTLHTINPNQTTSLSKQAKRAEAKITVEKFLSQFDEQIELDKFRLNNAKELPSSDENRGQIIYNAEVKLKKNELIKEKIAKEGVNYIMTAKDLKKTQVLIAKDYVSIDKMLDTTIKESKETINSFKNLSTNLIQLACRKNNENESYLKNLSEQIVQNCEKSVENGEGRKSCATLWGYAAIFKTEYTPNLVMPKALEPITEDPTQSILRAVGEPTKLINDTFIPMFIDTFHKEILFGSILKSAVDQKLLIKPGSANSILDEANKTNLEYFQSITNGDLKQAKDLNNKYSELQGRYISKGSAPLAYLTIATEFLEMLDKAMDNNKNF